MGRQSQRELKAKSAPVSMNATGRRKVIGRSSLHGTEAFTVLTVVHEALRSPGQPLDTATRTFMESRFGHDFNQVRVHNVKAHLGVSSNIRSRPLYSGMSSCSPTWYGDTTPEMDPSEESFTGKLITKYNDAELKDPCVRECVKVHENVHIRQLTPVVKKIHECDVAAGKDWEKKGKCNEMANSKLNEPLKRWECEAYRKSFTCLTLKVLDSKSACSKSPHREQVQKHRGYEGCEMKRYCEEARTPGAGIPNV